MKESWSATSVAHRSRESSTAEPARRLCRGAPVVIDRFDLWRQGADAIWLGSSVRAARGERPWVIAPPGRRR
ncbi:MAG: hypothetical protein EXQ92_13210 [Alphaproteobacteria bacterium]|nr:hypothetical protein [Alphaproteobacteria bacterium]